MQAGRRDVAMFRGKLPSSTGGSNLISSPGCAEPGFGRVGSGTRCLRALRAAENNGSELSRLSGRFTVSTMAKINPIPVDDQCLFFRQIVDSSPACSILKFHERTQCSCKRTSDYGVNKRSCDPNRRSLTMILLRMVHVHNSSKRDCGNRFDSR